MIGTIAKLWGAAALVAGASLFAETAAEQPPVPSSETEQENAGGKMAGNLLSGTLMPQIPSNISITNDGAIRVEESRKVIFEGPHVHMVTDTGVEVFADYAQADMDQGKVFLKGNLAIYQGDGRTRTNSLVRADSAEFDWENEVLLTDAIRAKMEGLILRSGKFESGRMPPAILIWKPLMPPSRRKTSASLSPGFPRTGYACIRKTGFLSRT